MLGQCPQSRTVPSRPERSTLRRSGCERCLALWFRYKEDRRSARGGFCFLFEYGVFRIDEGHPLFGFFNLDFGVSGGFLVVQWTRQGQNAAPVKSSRGGGPGLTLRPESIRQQRRVSKMFPCVRLAMRAIFMINVLRG